MTDSEWETGEDGAHLLGKITDNRLINTQGVIIRPYDGDTIISQFDQDGYSTTPRIYCD